MLMIRLAQSCTLQYDSRPYLAGYGPKMDPSFLGALAQLGRLPVP